MSAGYCYFCDAPADGDPCPICGKTLHRPEATKRKRAEQHHDAVVSTEPTGDQRTQLAPWIKYVVVIAVLVIIGLFLRSPFGI